MRSSSQGTVVALETEMGSGLRGLKITPSLECHEHYVFGYADINILRLHFVRSLPRRLLNLENLLQLFPENLSVVGPYSDVTLLRHQVTLYVTAPEGPSLGKGYGRRILIMGTSPAFSLSGRDIIFKPSFHLL